MEVSEIVWRRCDIVGVVALIRMEWIGVRGGVVSEI